MHLGTCTRLAAVGALLSAASPSPAQTITAITPPYAWKFASSPMVSADGEYVAGTFQDFGGSNQNTVFLRRADGHMTIIAAPAPYTTHVCIGISEHGDQVFLTADNGAGPVYIWHSDGTFTYPFGTDTDNLMRGMSADGRVLLGGNITGTFTWTAETGYTYLTPAFNRRARPSAMSYNGSIVVGDCPRTFPVGDPPQNGSEVTATQWVNGAVTLLHTPDSSAYGVNGDGTVIVGDFRQSGSPQIAYRWGTITGPLNFPQGPQGAVADRVSGDGTVITGSGLHTTAGGIPYNGPWIWTQTTGAIPFEDYLTARGVDLKGWTLRSVQSISMDAMVFAGTGTYQDEDLVFVVDLRKDTDGDSLYDHWETGGVPYMDGAGVVHRLTLEGANPLRKDLYVEVDSQAGHEPPAAAIAAVVAAFDQAPVTVGAPGGRPGIALHVQVDDADVVATGPYGWAEFHQQKDARFGTAAERALADWPQRRRAKAMAFRYAQSIDALAGGVTGMAELVSDAPGAGLRRGSNDFIVALGGAQSLAGYVQLYAGTFMHQLGHTLGLYHNGPGATGDLSPVNRSVMNGLWQGAHAYDPPAGPVLDYSRAALGPVTESSLDEAAGIGSAITGVATPIFVRSPGGPSACGETVLNTWGVCTHSISASVCINYAPLLGPVDWNNDGVIAPAGQAVCADINNSAGAVDQFASITEWPLIALGFRDSPFYSDGATPAPADSCLTLALYEHLAALPAPAAPPQCPVTPPIAGGPDPAEFAVCQPGPVAFTIHPTGTGPFTVQWRRFDEPQNAWVNLSDGAMPLGTQVAGANGATLTLTGATGAELGTTARFSYLLTDTCGQAVASGEARLLFDIPTLTITQQPGWVRTCENTTATLSVATAPAVPTTVTWQRLDPTDQTTWLPVVDGLDPAACATFSGAQSLTLAVQWAPEQGCPSRHTLRAVVANACGESTTSDPVTVDSLQPADFNGDEDVGTDADIEAFFACLGGSCCPTCSSQDFNNDGDMGTDADIEAFFRVLGGGPC